MMKSLKKQLITKFIIFFLSFLFFFCDIYVYGDLTSKSEKDNQKFTKVKQYQVQQEGNQGDFSNDSGLIEKIGKKKRKKISILTIVISVTLITAAILVLVSVIRKNNKDNDKDQTDIEDPEFEWIKIPAGYFKMGDNFNIGNYQEKPVHRVYLDEYYIAKYEVTFTMYDSFCDETGRIKPNDMGWGRGSRPVINISWIDTKAFCEWLSQKKGENIHPPTEAQWEKAARGETQRKYPWGNHSPFYNSEYYCNYAPDLSQMDLDGYLNTAPVGSFPRGASIYGVEDMAGNVLEWCSDWFSEDYYSKSPETNPTGPENPNSAYMRIMRGGSFISNDRDIRCSWRGGGRMTYKYKNLGIRLVKEDN